MTPRTTPRPARLLLLSLSLGVAACAPTLSGEPCTPGIGCPTGQTCLQQASGGFICRDGLVDAGPGDGGFPTDAGPGLNGTVTVNGLKKPTSNAAWVYLYEGDTDGGAKQSVQTDENGYYSFPTTSATRSYTLVAEYDISGTGFMTDPNAKYARSGAVNGLGTVPINIQTYSCTVLVTNTNTGSGDNSQRLVEAVADLPDVRTGRELRPDAGIDAGVSGLSGTNPLLFQADGGDPFSIGRYAFRPFPTPPADPKYTFTFSAPGYPGVACTVVRDTSSRSPPTDLSLETDGGSATDKLWSLSGSDTLAWTLPSGTGLVTLSLLGPLRFATYDLLLLDAGTSSVVLKGDSLFDSGNSSCPSGPGSLTHCFADLTAYQIFSNPPALDLEGSTQELVFQTEP